MDEELKKKQDELAQREAQLQEKEKEITLQKDELAKQKGEVADIEAKKEALGKESARVQEDLTKLREEKRELLAKDKTFEEKFRNEQLKKAEDWFFSAYQYEPDKKALVLAEFKKLDNGSLDVDNIKRDFLRARLSLEPDKYAKLEAEMDGYKKEAENMKSQISSSGFLGLHNSIPSDTVELDREDIIAAQWAGLPLARYKELKSRGKI
jgi:DNA repair exonuclease SbcCD ATPase subunit